MCDLLGFSRSLSEPPPPDVPLYKIMASALSDSFSPGFDPRISQNPA